MTVCLGRCRRERNTMNPNSIVDYIMSGIIHIEQMKIVVESNLTFRHTKSPGRKIIERSLTTNSRRKAVSQF